MTLKAISATKGNRLYWLGRYTERVYINLHILRRYYDRMLDSPSAYAVYDEYLRRLEAPNFYNDVDSFWVSYLYDPKNPSSIYSGLTAANDNGIVLREEIMSETLSYIHMSISRVNEVRDHNIASKNITELQPITDYLLAFWGSIDERIFDKRIRNFIRVGRLVENIDMHIRFLYPHYRIKEAYDRLKECASAEDGIFDQMILSRLDSLFAQDVYEKGDPEYRATALKFINHLVLI